ncbi:fasciclin-3-like isoform X2 [Arctopsyche grandis]|uniref:fasciclin-3-like isoform X2 n=1 Tax=Arctopsyche grandis TaxID=121162 RepID=UPI00406D73D6
MATPVFKMTAPLAGKLIVVAAVFSVAFANDAAQVDVLTKEVVALPGQSVNLLCRVSYSINFCQFSFPGITTLSNIYETENAYSNNIKYHGSGFSNGECGISIEKVDESNNGEFKCIVSPKKGERFMDPGVISVIIAKAPQRPILSPTVAGSYQIGDILQTGCIVRDGRPRANISWTLDDVPFIDGVQQLRTSESGSDLITVSQNISRRLSTTDAGSTLKCIVEHIALRPQDSVATAQINVEFKPLPQEDPLRIYGIKIGETAQINVTIYSNPLPKIDWIVDNDLVSDSSYDGSGRFHSAPMTPLGKATYNATLTISPVEREDTEKTFILKARNIRGETIYNIKISTLEEPEGVDFGAGGIVGIVIAVIFLLVIVFLLIFAKATNRWCFGDRVEHRGKPRSAGESDTNKEDLLTSPADRVASPTARSADSPSINSLYVDSDDSMAHEEVHINTPPNRANVRSYSTDIY